MLVNDIKSMKKFHKVVSLTKPYPFLRATERVPIEIYLNCDILNDHKNSECQPSSCNTPTLPSKTGV
jgi:hypothetical protein